MSSRTNKSLLRLVFVLIFLVVVINLVFRNHSYRGANSCWTCCQRNANIQFVKSSPGGLRVTQDNYGREIDQLAQHFNLDASYLKALIALECAGREQFNPRFEPHVCRRLHYVRSRRYTHYEGINASLIGDATDQAIQNLATSWGPFQIMGYKCIGMNVKVSDLRGDSCLYWGVKWIDENYGSYIRAGKYKDAFHIHNTGMPYPSSGRPLTHDPSYVSRGIKYMGYFDQFK